MASSLLPSYLWLRDLAKVKSQLHPYLFSNGPHARTKYQTSEHAVCGNATILWFVSATEVICTWLFSTVEWLQAKLSCCHLIRGWIEAVVPLYPTAHTQESGNKCLSTQNQSCGMQPCCGLYQPPKLYAPCCIWCYWLLNDCKQMNIFSMTVHCWSVRV